MRSGKGLFVLGGNAPPKKTLRCPALRTAAERQVRNAGARTPLLT